MRLAAFLVAILAFAAYSGAQVSAPVEGVKITADSFGHVGEVLQIRGNVQIVRGATLVTADEVDATIGSASGIIELRGNVRLTTTDSGPITVHKRWK
jgi:lipopolysaccharide export system protein LptA